MIKVAIGKYKLLLTYNGLPSIYDHYVKHARLFDEFDLGEPNTDLCFVGIGADGDWPSLVVAQSYSPSIAGFHPGVLIVPETQRVFIGAGTRLLLYDFTHCQRLWQDEAELVFLAWQQHDDFVVLTAETELATWTTKGDKLWTTYVEPPWEYQVENGLIKLDVMGKQSSFPIETGPP